MWSRLWMWFLVVAVGAGRSGWLVQPSCSVERRSGPEMESAFKMRPAVNLRDGNTQLRREAWNCWSD